MRFDLEDPNLHNRVAPCQSEDEIFVCAGCNLCISRVGFQPVPKIDISLTVRINGGLVD